MKTSKIIGIVLIIAGLAVLIFGIVEFNQFRGSVAGKVSNAMINLTGSRSDQEMKYIIMMIAGGAAALVGIFVTVKK